MKLIARIVPENPLQFEQLELAVDREISEIKYRVKPGISMKKICEHGTLYLEFEGLSDEQSAKIQQSLEWEFGTVKASILWV